MRKRLRRDERGSVLVMTAILLVAILGMAALAVDVAGWYQMRRQLQSAADAAALAGAQDLVNLNADAARTDAHSYVTMNISGATATVTTPFNNDSRQIKVTVTKRFPSIFGGVLGLPFKDISATAVAKHPGPNPPSAIFANNTTCGTGGVTITSNNLHVVGGTHSNGYLELEGNNDALGTTGYNDNCGYQVHGNGDSFGGSPSPQPAPTATWPEDFIADPPTCTQTAPAFVWLGNNRTIPPGVYCAAAITIDGNNLTGNGVTFKAASFTLIGNAWNMKAAFKDLLFYYTGIGSLSLDGNMLHGNTVFAPYGTIEITGNSSNGQTQQQWYGFAEGNNVLITGNNAVFTGTGPPLPGDDTTTGFLMQ